MKCFSSESQPSNRSTHPFRDDQLPERLCGHSPLHHVLSTFAIAIEGFDSSGPAVPVQQTFRTTTQTIARLILRGPLALAAAYVPMKLLLQFPELLASYVVGGFIFFTLWNRAKYVDLKACYRNICGCLARLQEEMTEVRQLYPDDTRFPWTTVDGQLAVGFENPSRHQVDGFNWVASGRRAVSGADNSADAVAEQYEEPRTCTVCLENLPKREFRCCVAFWSPLPSQMHPRLAE